MYTKIRTIFYSLALFLLVGCATSSVQESSLIATEGVDTIEFTVPLSKIKMTVPKNDLVKAEKAASKSYRYFIYNGKTTDFSISGWFEPANEYKGVEKHWNEFLKSWSGNKPENVIISKIGQWETVSYNLKYQNCEQQNIKAFLVKSDTWIELHISSPCNQSMDIKSYLEKIKVEQKN